MKKLALSLKDEVIPFRQQDRIVDDLKRSWVEKLNFQELVRIQKERKQALLQVK